MIRVECDPDYTIVRTLTNLSKRNIIHHGGKFEVCRAIKNSENSKGMIDEDPGYTQPRYLENLIISEDLPSLNLKVLNDETRNNVLILLCPRLEEWIIRTADLCNIDMERRFNLPRDPRRLKRIINYRLENLEKLVNELRGSSQRISKLENLLRS